MNEPPDPRTRLLAETFHDDWATGPARAMALRAAAQVRRGRLIRRTALAGSSAVVALAWLVLASRPRSTPTVDAPVAVAPAAAAFEIITDAQLYAELRDRSVLILPQEKNGPRIVLLGP